MDVFTYSSARQNLGQLLKLALKHGKVAIKRRDGTKFVIRPEKQKTSPLNVKGVRVAKIPLDAILAAIKEGHKTY